MEAYKKEGLGGLEITPIYGVKGKEKEFVNFLSDKWIELLVHTLKEAERLDLGIDMATGTGWPFGGPWVNKEHACKTVEHKVYEVSDGQSLKEKVVFIQEPYLRTVNNQVYEVHDTTITGVPPTGSLKEPLLAGNTPFTIDRLIQPVEANKNLQGLALDQVRFERPLPLHKLIAYGPDGRALDLTKKVSTDGTLDWVAPAGTWRLYAIFTGWHGKMVERAGPGGEGNVIDHFSKQALTSYLKKFDDALSKADIQTLRGFFNDSYEVDDARGNADWTPLLFDEFRKRRGYDLESHLPSLFGNTSDDSGERILCDYRETISELVLENFTRPWRDWAYTKNAIVRNQAHGSPANILDLYATVDIPEMEGVEPLRIKMASSAGNVTGKKLISAESATWLKEHFQSNLYDIKVAVDRFMLNGVNHIFYHGTTYSPKDEAWPGRLFYASVHLNPRNSLWPHFSALNQYVERCQSLLQSSSPSNDVLLYYPIYDRFSTPGKEMIEHFDAVGNQFDKTVFKEAAEYMLNAGYGFDFISDKQLKNVKASGANVITEGGSIYRTIMVPHGKYIPLETMQHVVSLAESGAMVLLPGGFPETVNGYRDHEVRAKSYAALIGNLKKLSAGSPSVISIGKGKIWVGEDAKTLLDKAGVKGEALGEHGITFLRKKTASSTLYFLIATAGIKEKWIPVNATGEGVKVYHPMSGEIGMAKMRTVNGQCEVLLTLEPQETIFVEITSEKTSLPELKYADSSAKPFDFQSPWILTFLEGGPELPQSVKMKRPAMWTTLPGEVYADFSGCASYNTVFRKPAGGDRDWLLKIPMIGESVEVILNGKSSGTLLRQEDRVVIKGKMLQKNNLLELRVCNLMANRIAYLDRNNVQWKKFYNINFPAREPSNRIHNLFNAAHWPPKPSGISGKVQLVPLEK